MDGMREDREALRARAEAFGLRYLEAVPDSCLQDDLSRHFPAAWAREQRLLPVLLDGRPCLLVADPDDLGAQQKAALVAGRALEPVVAPAEAILDAIARCAGAAPGAASGAEGVAAGADKTAAAAESAPAPPAGDTAVGDLLADAEAAPATRLVNSLLLQAVREGASDVHVEPFSDHLAVRFRIDGVLYARTSPPRALEAPLVARLKVMSGMDIAERRLPQDGMAEVRVGTRTIDIRVSSVPVAHGERIVMRLLNRDDACLPLGSLGMASGTLDAFRSLMRTPNGIVVVSGPTGSGKTTTLYAALGELDSARRNVLTIEDPVEYRLPGIGQIQVKPKIGLTFASGLRHILRQDPDVILVGETRDPETAEIAVRASLTGHLVFTTLHTNDAPSAVMRLADMGVPPYLLASSLRGVLAQRLVRTLCPHCRARVAASAADLAHGFLDPRWRARLAGSGVPAARGCERCLGGYRGRQGVFELMVCTPEILSLVRHGVADGADLRQAAREAGMSPMIDDALAKVEAGVTDLSEVAGALAQ